MTKIILIILLIVVISSGIGGIMFYFRKFKALASETGDLLKAIFVALQDGKLSAEEKAKIIEEAMDLSPIAKDLKTQFVADAKDLGGKITAKVKGWIAKRKEGQV